jgi:ribonuclease P protein component
VPGPEGAHEGVSSGLCRFPKSVRLLRSQDFRRIYNEGTRFAGPFFAAFCLQEPAVPSGPGGPRVGFTVPRALGKAVVRNRIKRRVREAVRLHLNLLSPQWSIIINPRRKALGAPLPELEREIERLFLRCQGS